MDSVTANGSTEYSGTCCHSSQFPDLHTSGPSDKNKPETPVLSSSLPLTSFSIAKSPKMDSITSAKCPTEYSGTYGQASPQMSAMMDSLITNSPTDYSGTGGQVSKFLDCSHSFVPVSADVSATGSATSSEKASSSHEATSSSNASTSASEADPSYTSVRSFVSNASFDSGSSNACSTISAGQELSGLGVTAPGGTAWRRPRRPPSRRPAPTNGNQFGVYSPSTYADCNNNGAISGEYEEMRNLAMERLRAIVNNVEAAPDTINGTPVSASVAESNERLRIMMAAIMNRYSFGNEGDVL
ncbi:hypothetical protein RUND412_005489 [Rhizina undulata]